MFEVVVCWLVMVPTQNDDVSAQAHHSLRTLRAIVKIQILIPKSFLCGFPSQV